MVGFHHSHYLNAENEAKRGERDYPSSQGEQDPNYYRTKVFAFKIEKLLKATTLKCTFDKNVNTDLIPSLSKPLQ